MAAFTPSVRIVPNPPGIALLARTPFMAGAMKEKGDAVAEGAKSVAPWGPGKGGHYRNMIRATTAVIDGKAGARVNAWKFTSAWIEFGNPPHTPVAWAPLRKGCDIAGLSLSGGRA